jgi:gamma-glutamylcyclotransferase (GGCT)/AIG2-like uncharacterized protein YtfP
VPHTAGASPRTTSRASGRLAQLSGDQEALFVYGTLLFPEVLSALLGRVPESEPATVEGWRVAALPGRVYPGLVPGRGVTKGLLITGLTADEWRMLDTFESDEYQLRRVSVADGRRPWTYVLASESNASSDDWNATDFRTHELAAYVERCARWRRQYQR